MTLSPELILFPVPVLVAVVPETRLAPVGCEVSYRPCIDRDRVFTAELGGLTPDRSPEVLARGSIGTPDAVSTTMSRIRR